MLSFLVHGLIVSTWVSRIPSIKSALHLDDGAFGLALLGMAIGSVTAIPACGWLVTRYGSRHAARWTGLGFCAALVLPALARDGRTLFFALLIYGAMGGANDVAMNAQAISTEKLLGTPAMSRFHSMFSVGGMAGAGIGSLIASRAIAPFAHLAGAAAMFVVLALLGMRLMPETDPKIVQRAPARFARIPPALMALSLIGFCIFLSEGAVADWAGVYLKQNLGASDGLAPVGYAAFSVAMAIFRFAGDNITLRIGRALTIRAGGLLAAAGLAFTISVRSPWWAIAGFAAAGAGFSSIIPLVFAVGGRVKSVSEGTGVATVGGIGYLGFLAGPPAIGFISQVSSLRAGLGLVVALSAAAAMLVSVVQRGNGDLNDVKPLSPGSRNI